MKAADWAVLKTLFLKSERKEREKMCIRDRSKQKLLRSAQIQWDMLENDMLKRCNKNFEWIRSMTEERQQDVIEKLTLELTHVANPKDWWEKDYPCLLYTSRCV